MNCGSTIVAKGIALCLKAWYIFIEGNWLQWKTIMYDNHDDHVFTECYFPRRYSIRTRNNAE